MNYTPYSSSKKGNYVFYIIIIIALAVIAVVAFIGLSNMNKTEPEPTPNKTISDKTQSSDKNNSQEYESNDSSYSSNDGNNNSITENPKNEMSNFTSMLPTNDDVKDEPYKQKSYTMPVNGDILKDFSLEALQYSATYNDMRLHPAVDIACKAGTYISSLTDGKVLSVEESADLGNVITIDHGDNLIVKYACIKESKVKAGDSVKSGDLIGTVGTIPSESSDQSHLHIEATENGKAISVLKFFN